MKNLVKISVLVLIVVLGVVYSGCDKKNIIDSENNDLQIANYDSVGLIHNDICSKAILIIQKKGNVNEEEVYNIVVDIYETEYNVENSEMPSYNDVKHITEIINDTNMNLVDKYKMFVTNCSILEESYLFKIDSLIEKLDENTNVVLNKYEEDIQNDKELTEEQKTSLFIFTDVAKNSYLLWNTGSRKDKPHLGSILYADALGTLAGAIFTNFGGAVISGSTSSLITFLSGENFFD